MFFFDWAFSWSWANQQPLDDHFRYHLNRFFVAASCNFQLPLTSLTHYDQLPSFWCLTFPPKKKKSSKTSPRGHWRSTWFDFGRWRWIRRVWFSHRLDVQKAYEYWNKLTKSNKTQLVSLPAGFLVAINRIKKGYFKPPSFWMCFFLLEGGLVCWRVVFVDGNFSCSDVVGIFETWMCVYIWVFWILLNLLDSKSPFGGKIVFERTYFPSIFLPKNPRSS